MYSKEKTSTSFSVVGKSRPSPILPSLTLNRSHSDLYTLVVFRVPKGTSSVSLLLGLLFNHSGLVVSFFLSVLLVLCFFLFSLFLY